ncbi:MULTISPECIES: glycoside hydrolase family 18 protein [Streptomyces]|uniref:chitinase n=1 Tax=Streptomyces tsukubensis (strain DSM 42081 / NBRC 108919 / NRRL 18488 / 9993) TaxID=1114943 RepID=I2NBF4_STRT9|nr:MULTISPECIES: glycoside hydrolase family 18 protein [Streptomyces]AZK98070.1 chitinase [Streptomyces tsukubensis]EIF94351.1 chitinase [Streptomyces tsukubensis NRRL18488]MYS68112.1 chitinase [Streptomyces sp. SID5473]QKM66005.1 chitinase [Streptomyces tsukubensis NRRL18488]TAI42286.1 glycoside hydrolase family 18 protein [Streptomyces tsukubensis]
MFRRTSAFLATALLASLIAGPTTAHADDDDNRRLPGHRVAYFTGWSVYSGFSAKKVQDSGQAAKLTVINYAFGNISPEGTCFEDNLADQADAWADYQRPISAADSVDGVADAWDQPLKGSFNQLRKLKAKNPHLKAVISIGGWGWSKYFSDVAATDAARKKFVASCVDLYIKGNLPQLGSPEGGPGSGAGVFDGIDLDWEHPGGDGLPDNSVRPEDGRNFTLLLAEFRRQLDALGDGPRGRHLLTAAVAANTDIADRLELRKVARQVDYLNLMTYTMHGSWEPLGPTNHQANLYTDPADPSGVDYSYSADRVVRHYLAGGLPAHKAVLGVPSWGYGWTGVPAGAKNGLYQPATGMSPRGGGQLPYKAIKDLPGAVHTDRKHGAAWKYDGTEFWTYDTPATAAQKARYTQRKGLGGVMVWSLDGDDAQGSLIAALDRGLRR